MYEYSIKDAEKRIREARREQLEDVIRELEKDERAGVRKLVEKYYKEQEKQNAEYARVEAMKAYERQYDEYAFIGGVDEVGRGPLAGPVVTCAIILPKDCTILYVNDSKKLSEKKREELYPEILDKAISYGIGIVPPKRIDEINILQATYEAMRLAIAKLDPQPELMLNDAVTIPGISIRQVPIIKGDAKSQTIAAASIVAKVTRDRMMTEYDKQYPGYDFAGNKGYGSQEHIAALKKLGPCPIHRRSFIHSFGF